MATLCSTPPNTHPWREGVSPTIPSPDPRVASLLQELGACVHQKTRSLAIVHQALRQLQALSLWQEQNQRQALDLGAIPLLLELLTAHTPAAWRASALPAPAPSNVACPEPAPEGEATVVLCLNLMSSLCTNDDVAAQVAGVPACAATLTALLASASAPHGVTVSAARCLTNLTQSSLQAQAEALEAGMLDCAIKLAMSEGQPGLVKLGCCLMANVTTPLGSTARAPILAHPHLLAQLVGLAKPGQPEAIIVLACQVLGNLMREEVPGSAEQPPAGSNIGSCASRLAAQDELARRGALEALQAHVHRPDCSNKVLAASLNALSCLVLGHARNAAALRAVPGVAAALGLALEQRADAWEADYDAAAAVLAVHTLVLVLGHMACNSSSNSSAHNSAGGTSTGPAQASRLSLEGPDANLVDGAVRVVVHEGGQMGQMGQASEASSGTAVNSVGASLPPRSGADGAAGAVKEAMYVSLAESAKLIGVKLPPALQCAQKDGSCVLPPIKIAELRYRVSYVLLPRLRSPNPYFMATAAASLYHLASACGGGAALEARRLMADSSLAAELLRKLSSPAPQIVQGCLAVLDVLSSEPQSGRILLQSGWLPAVMPLLDSRDVLVQRWADRALCSLFIARGGHMQR